MTGPLTLFLGGDVMTGRGVDQVLPHPGDPRLWEPYTGDARTYVTLAEARNGPIPRPVPLSWPWGDALQLTDDLAPAARIFNLETSVTTTGAPDPDKGIHYRMNPANLGCLTCFKPDICVLANNHVLDFGSPGLHDTLASLNSAGIRAVGAGGDSDQAYEPVVIPTPVGGRVIVMALGVESSGIPPSWAATQNEPGVAFLRDLSDATADRISDRVCQGRQPGDAVVVSLHWGSNWGYHVPDQQVRFAHRLIDRGADLIYGHSSHHPRPIEVYRSKLVLYGCGDLIDDYEGITGHEDFRDDLRLLYFPSLDPATGQLTHLTMWPMQSRRMRLQHASTADSRWVRQTIEETSRPFATLIVPEPDGSLILRNAGS